MSSILITGVSSGIGNALSHWYLNPSECGHEYQVFGVSRRTPEDLISNDSFHFAATDLAESDISRESLLDLLESATDLDLVILNAGILGQIDDMRDTSLEQLRHLMDVNVWANKTVLDAVFDKGRSVKQVVAISSGAAVNGNRGWNGYSISKAALNMLVQLYSREQPNTHFCALAPGLVDTAMQDYLCGFVADERFGSLENLKSKRNTPEMPTPQQAAKMLGTVITEVALHQPSGQFVDVRSLPWR